MVVAAETLRRWRLRINFRFGNVEAIDDNDKNVFIKGAWTQTGLDWVLDKMEREEVAVARINFTIWNLHVLYILCLNNNASNKEFS